MEQVYDHNQLYHFTPCSVLLHIILVLYFIFDKKNINYSEEKLYLVKSPITSNCHNCISTLTYCLTTFCPFKFLNNLTYMILIFNANIKTQNSKHAYLPCYIYRMRWTRSQRFAYLSKNRKKSTHITRRNHRSTPITSFLGLFSTITEGIHVFCVRQKFANFVPSTQYKWGVKCEIYNMTLRLCLTD